MFNVETSKDFYSMLVDDFDDFVAEEHSARRALHCAITAYHLHEWVWGDWLKNDEAVRNVMGVSKNKSSFIKFIEDKCIFFSVVRDLVNETKHFARDQWFKTHSILEFCEYSDTDLHAQGSLVIDFGEDAGGASLATSEFSVRVRCPVLARLFQSIPAISRSAGEQASSGQLTASS